MKKFCAAAFILLFTFACKESAPAPEGALASVGSRYITQAEFDEKIKEFDPLYEKYAKTEFGRKGFLEALIREAIIERDAAERRIEDSAEFKAAMAELEKDFDLRREAARKHNLRRIWEEKVNSGDVFEVTEEEIKDYYKKYSYEMTIKQIVLDKADDASRVMREYKGSNSANFARGAARYSILPEVKLTKNEEVTFMPGEYIPEIENIAANSAMYTMQGFVKTPLGFHIIMKVKEKKLSYQDAKDRIEMVLKRRKEDAFLESLAEKYEVKIYETHE